MCTFAPDTRVPMSVPEATQRDVVFRPFPLVAFLFQHASPSSRRHFRSHPLPTHQQEQHNRLAGQHALPLPVEPSCQPHRCVWQPWQWDSHAHSTCWRTPPCSRFPNDSRFQRLSFLKKIKTVGKERRRDQLCSVCSAQKTAVTGSCRMHHISRGKIMR